MIIGLSGYARSGKDEAAKVLVEEFGFKRVAFADKLREFLYVLNPDIRSESGYDVWDVQGVIDHYGWDGYKEGEYAQPIRQYLQRLGTEAGRQVLWDSIWIDAALHDVNQFDNIVVTDCRFPNEAGAIRERGGMVWRINRDGVGPANDHPSETSLDNYPDFHQYLSNDGTLTEFHNNVARAAKRWLERNIKETV